jgi:hypothetical protein
VCRAAASIHLAPGQDEPRIVGNLGPERADRFHRNLHKNLKADYVIVNSLSI